MKKKEYGFMFTFMTIVILLTAKFWIKQRFELQALEFALLFVVSWGLKFLLFKKVLKKKKDKPETGEEKDIDNESKDESNSNIIEEKKQDDLEKEDKKEN